MTRVDASAASLLRDAEARLARSGIESARLDAEVLLARALGTTRAGLIGRARDVLSAAERERFLQAVERRADRYPLQYITGVQEFYSLELEVDPRVLIPRAETEMIVDEVLRRVSGPGRDGASAGAITIADVGTGSGCIAVALARQLPKAHVRATDVSRGALEVAARNAARHGVADRIDFLLGPGLEPLREPPRPTAGPSGTGRVERARVDDAGAPAAGQSALDDPRPPAIEQSALEDPGRQRLAGRRGGLDVLVSNPPYIAASELISLQPELAFEPREALTSGPTGLEVIEEILGGAADVVAPAGWLMIELGAGRHREVEDLVDRQAWKLEPTKPDMQGIPRLLIARRRS